MTNLSSHQKQYLKGLAHKRKPIVQVGKNGVTEQLITDIKRALASHELIKVKFISFQEEKQALAEGIAERSQSEQVMMIGNMAVFYREQSNPQKRKIKLPPESGADTPQPLPKAKKPSAV